MDYIKIASQNNFECLRKIDDDRIKYFKEKKFAFELLGKCFFSLFNNSFLFEVYPSNLKNFKYFLENDEFINLILFIKKEYKIFKINFVLEWINYNFTKSYAEVLIEKFHSIEEKPKILIKDEYISTTADNNYFKVNQEYLKILNKYLNKNYPEEVIKKINVIHEIFKKGAFKGDPHALCYLGFFWQKDFDKKPNNVIAFKLIKLSFEKKLLEAGAYYGSAFLEGIGTDIDCKKAISIFEKAHNNGCRKSTTILGKIKLNEKDYKSAFTFFNLAHLEGIIEATYYLGLMYQNGHGVKKDNKNAALFFTNALINDYTAANYRYGLLCLYEENKIRCGIDHIIHASMNGHTDAMYELSKLYYQGKYIILDMQAYIDHLNNASEAGNYDAMYEYSQILYHGAELDADKYHCICNDIIDEGGKFGSTIMIKLRKLYNHGVYVEQDIPKCIHYMKILNNNGYEKSKHFYEKLRGEFNL